MEHTDTTFLFAGALVLLGAAVIAVPLSKRLGLGSVLGYLVAGIVIGPQVIGLFPHPDDILHVSELGVVLLLFVIGLELKPSRLWGMRKDIFGLGAGQVVLSGLGIMLYPLLVLGWSWQASLVAGFGLALSSTTLAMQILEERGDTQAAYGRRTFAVLLFQDLAFIPILALVPLLAPQPAGMTEPVWLIAGKIVGALAVVIIAGRYLMNPLFRVLARAGAREIMTAAALFIVLAAASAMVIAGLSMAMGAFLAGVLLAESRYRHQLEADIEPFRGILLGLFFIAVGMTIDLGVIATYWAQLLIGVAQLLLVKTLIVYGLMRLSGSDHNDAIAGSMVIPQGGEFGFVLYAAAAAAGILTLTQSSELISAVVLSMAATPLLVRLVPYLQHGQDTGEIVEDFSDAGGTALIIGFGRFGQVVSQLLLARGIDVTTIDNDVEMIESAAGFGFKVYYGDGRRIDVLRAAGAESAQLIAICTDGRDTTSRIAELVGESFPEALIGVRSFDRAHSLDLLSRNIDFEVRETFDSAIAFGRSALEALGVSHHDAVEIENDVRARDLERLQLQQTGDIGAGVDKLRITPEPLIPPKQEPTRLNPDAVDAVKHLDDDTIPSGD